MAKNFIQPGDTIDYVAGGAVNSGAPILIGTRLGIPLSSGVSGDTIAMRVTGVWEISKATGAITVGAALYWDDTNKKVTTTASGNTLCGWAVAAQASGDATAKVKLLG